jgi:transcriptional regulator with XRE-family HTH domain
MSVVELSRRAAMSRATLTQIEARGANPALETLYALANALDARSPTCWSHLVDQSPPASSRR